MVRFKNRYLLCEIIFENENENSDSLVIDFRTLRKVINLNLYFNIVHNK